MQELDEGKIYTEKSHTLWKMDEHGPSSSMSYLLKLVSFQNVKLPTGISRYELHGHMVIPNHVPSNGSDFHHVKLLALPGQAGPFWGNRARRSFEVCGARRLH
jgi:hypothetical protein